ncbi:hypothetical protein RLDS_03395 [Sphingobium lactosutens DS20]|uniref:Uncharacterized protein n=1 Tax=Sphingobium lactosutens DS20 TaxID=1331060 RepID=T0HXZ0_9SPHN|nr:hypothetical protein RLDS_03395 [Sphingobium lactosutens DS20]
MKPHPALSPNTIFATLQKGMFLFFINILVRMSHAWDMHLFNRVFV